MVAPLPVKEIRRNGMIAELRKARRDFACVVCPLSINKGTEYYSLVMGGGGLGWLKSPDRTHVECLEAYLEKQGDSQW